MRTGMKCLLGLALALGLLGALGGVALAEVFTASDASTDPAYAVGEWFVGDNGGTGFGEWRQIGNNNAPNHDINDGFAFYADGVLGRSFEGEVVLGTGTFKAEALHGYTDRFSGFVLYGTGDQEIVRWGITRAEDPGGSARTGFWYATGSGQTLYQLGGEADSESLLQTRLDYSLTWESMDSGKTAISLSVGAGGTSWADVSTTLEGIQGVNAIGILVDGTSHESHPLRVDNLSVTGVIVPEPGTLSLVVLGTAAIAAWRRRRS